MRKTVGPHEFQAIAAVTHDAIATFRAAHCGAPHAPWLELLPRDRALPILLTGASIEHPDWDPPELYRFAMETTGEATFLDWAALAPCERVPWIIATTLVALLAHGRPLSSDDDEPWFREHHAPPPRILRASPLIPFHR